VLVILGDPPRANCARCGWEHSDELLELEARVREHQREGCERRERRER
jgi:hypothetical protein